MNLNTTRITNIILALGMALSASIQSVSFGSAQDNGAYIRRARSLDAEEIGVLNPVGLGFSARSENFYVVEDQTQERALSANSEVITLTPLSDRAGLARIAATIEDPLNIVFDNQNQRLLALQPTTGQLIEVRENPGGQLDQVVVIPHNLGRLTIQEPSGLAFDEGSGSLFMLDAAGPRILRLQLGPNRNFTGGRVSVIDLTSSGLVAPRGIAFDPATGHLHVFDLIDQSLYELGLNGQVITTRDLAPFGLRSPQAMLFAPSGDQTDDPAQTSLFIADSGLIRGRGAASSSQVTEDSAGQIMELSMVEPVAAAASNYNSTLIRTTDLSMISPPSPDPSGLTYIPEGNRLMVSDGEVEETAYKKTHFQGANVWELTVAGSVIRTANISPVAPTVVPMSDEPTGVAWNPNNGHYYFSDDTGSPDVYDLNPGADGLVGTSDDTWTGFSTSTYGGGDAEGISYDPVSNRLFVADGANAEVYEYTVTGTLINHFDVLGYGVPDPEAVEFNPGTGTLFVMSSNNSNPVIVETSRTGALLQTINISSANARVPAGLAIGPASNGSGERRFYIVDRGYDNNEMGNLIDGKLFEMSAPIAGSPTTPFPTFTPTSTPLPSSSPTNTPTSPPSGNAFLASFSSSGTVAGVSFADEDILRFDGQNWTLLFDGSDVGAGSADLLALSIVDADTILMAFGSNIALNGLPITPQDVVRFDATSLGPNTAGNFSMYFNGADVGLAASSEKIDALSVLPDGRILLSTTGDVSVPGAAGKDEDIVAFTPTSLGGNTSGTWSLYFDGSDVGLSNSSGEDTDALDIVGSNLYLSTTASFSVDGVAGAGEDVFICSPTSLGDVTACTFASALFFDGSAWGLAGNSLDGLQIEAATPSTTPTASPGSTPTPTNTPTATSILTSTSTATESPLATPTDTSVPTNSPTPTATLTPTNTSLPTSSPTNNPTSVPLGDSLFATFALSGTVGGVSFADEDILRFDGQTWSLFFDGSDVGAGSPDLLSISVVDNDTVLMVFSSAVTLNGLAVTPYDIVRFDATSLGNITAGTFSIYFNGADVGLDASLPGERIDAFGVASDGKILISTIGDVAVTGATGRDEDILAFSPSTLGSDTSGTWTMYFDGSDVGLNDTTDEDINGLNALDRSLYLSTAGAFSVNGVAGEGEDIFVCVPTSLGDVTACNFSPALFFDGSTWGLAGNDLDGFFLVRVSSDLASLEPSTPTFTPTPTSTTTNTPEPILTPTATDTPPATATDTFTPTATSTDIPTPMDTPATP